MNKNTHTFTRPIKNALELVAFAGILLALFFINLVICGIHEPEKLEIISAYRIPVVGTLAKAEVQKALTQIAKEEKR